MSFVDKIVDSRTSVDGIYVENFDGLRAVAALMVMCMHAKTIPTLAGGAPGVWIFFALSGYLLYSGFIKYSESISVKYIFSYLTRRIFRIFPLYIFFAYVYAFLFKGWTYDQQKSFFLVQFFFLKDMLHLWTVRTEMVLYLLLPLIMLLLFFIKNKTLKWVILILLALANIILFKNYQISILGTRNHLAIFLLGMAAVHLNVYIPRRLAPWFAYGALALILLLSTFSPWTAPLREILGVVERPLMYKYVWVFYPLCLLLLLSLSRFKSRFWSNRWLRLIGVCGYGFYLWHPMVIELVRGWGLDSFFWYQVACYSLNTILSITTYILIEKPGIAFGRLLSRWVQRDKSILFGLRPWAVCLLVIVLFCSYRQDFLLEKRNHIELTIYSPSDTVTKFFFADETGFREEKSAAVHIKGGAWQTVRTSFPEFSFNKIRFDPGGEAGIYRVKNITMHYPNNDKEVVFDLNAFSVGQQIDMLHVDKNTLIIETSKKSDDPILYYEGHIPSNLMNSRNIISFIFIMGFAGIFAGCIVMDKIFAWDLGRRSGELTCS
ncbi:acyltransferase family protein [Desulfogranum japonicum]|uniref:acyltransferase family protein n=1 Tax=Desulfogranum japonicum TaxID=231447 RepID=UPI00041BAAFB|nr:acyltransferase [Desulfogranum japonicum]